MNRTITAGLTTIALAAGIGCANMPYSQRDILEQDGDVFLYRDVTRTPESLELAVRIVQGGVLIDEYVWTRYEPAGSAECQRETVRIFCQHQGEDFTWADNDCDGSVDIVEGHEMDIEDEELRAGVYTELFGTYSGHALGRFDVTQQLADWHRWKGL
ncbi:MAG: hypothetical protein KJ955_05650 [Nanoarchaeota archaeon]|nr:hypothetical protein [Nanoarchaeota archaeon]